MGGRVSPFSSWIPFQPPFPGIYRAWESQCIHVLPTFSLPSSDGEKVVLSGSAGGRCVCVCVGGGLARKTYHLLRPPLLGRRSNSGAKLPGPPGAGLCSPSPGAPFCFAAGTTRGAGSQERVEQEAPEDWSAVERCKASQPLKGEGRTVTRGRIPRRRRRRNRESDTVSTAQLFKRLEICK